MANDILNSGFFEFSTFPIIEAEKLLPNCKGGNQKNTLIVINSSEENQEQIEFLKKILGAAKLDFENDILLLKITPKEGFSFISMRTKAADRFGDIDNMLVFGFGPTHFGLNLQVQKYQPFHFSKCGFLFADALSALEKDKNLKGALWSGMQTLFLNAEL